MSLASIKRRVARCKKIRTEIAKLEQQLAAAIVDDDGTMKEILRAQISMAKSALGES